MGLSKSSFLSTRNKENWNNILGEVVDLIGKQKAIDLYDKTKEIEDNGGMLMANGHDRKTPGGIYLHLLKKDQDIPRVEINEIFFQNKLRIKKDKKRATNMAYDDRVKMLKARLQGQDHVCHILCTFLQFAYFNWKKNFSSQNLPPHP